jgi:hypothetical protein
MGIPGNLGNSQGHFTKPGIPLHYSLPLFPSSYCPMPSCKKTITQKPKESLLAFVPSDHIKNSAYELRILLYTTLMAFYPRTEKYLRK